MHEMPPPTDGDQDQAAKILTVTGILTSLSVITVTVRFIARAKGSKHYGWDNWTMLAALVRFSLRPQSVWTAYSVTMTVSCSNRIRNSRGFNVCRIRETHLLLRGRKKGSSS